MPRTSQAVSDELYAKCQLELKKQGKSGEISRKLQAILSAKTNKIYIVCDVFGITKTTLFKWIKNFEADDQAGLMVKSGRGRKRLVDKSQEKAITDVLKAYPTITATQLKALIKQRFAIDISIASTYRLMHRLGFNYITARKQHYKQHSTDKTTFKKTAKYVPTR